MANIVPRASAVRNSRRSGGGAKDGAAATAREEAEEGEELRGGASVGIGSVGCSIGELGVLHDGAGGSSAACEGHGATAMLTC